MIYIKAIFLLIKVMLNIHKYKDFLDKPNGLGKKWTLYKRPIFQKKKNMKKANIPETKSDYFIYHAFEALETKTSKDFKKEMFDNLILGIIWYTSIQNTKKEINKTEKFTENKNEKNCSDVEKDINR